MTTDQLLREAQQAIAALMRGAEKDSDGAWGRIVMPSNAAMTAGEKVSEAIDAALSAPAQPASGEAVGLGASLLRQPVKSLRELSKTIPGGCYCPPGVCGAPVIMGQQTPCLRTDTTPPASQEQAKARCPKCEYQHGHAIGCENNPVDIALKASQEQAPPSTLGALAKRRIFDAIRGAYDLGYNDARNAKAVPGDGAPGYEGRNVEADHGGALMNSLNNCLKGAQPSETLRDVLQERFDLLHLPMPADAREAVAALVNAEVRIALDPAVSEQAAALVQRGRDEAQPSGEVVAALEDLMMAVEAAEEGCTDGGFAVGYENGDGVEVGSLFVAARARAKAALKAIYTAPQPAARVAIDREAMWRQSSVTNDWEVVDAYMEGISDAEAHHGIGGISGNGEG